MEIYGCPIHLAVDRLAQGVGDPMPRIGNNIVYMCLHSLGHLFHRLKPRMSRPEIPPLEILSHRGAVTGNSTGADGSP